MPKKVTILTCVTNGAGCGPGHTAIVLDDTVYSFENVGDWFSKGGNNASGWVTAKMADYLKKNEARPVLLQELSEKVRPQPVEDYIKKSIASDDDYLSSGVCSSLVASAVNAGFTAGFNPFGVDTPRNVYHLAKQKGIVASERGIWDPDKVNFVHRGLIAAKLAVDFPSAPVDY